MARFCFCQARAVSSRETACPTYPRKCWKIKLFFTFYKF
jgi:hypothetical protein